MYVCTGEVHIMYLFSFIYYDNIYIYIYTYILMHQLASDVLSLTYIQLTGNSQCSISRRGLAMDILC